MESRGGSRIDEGRVNPSADSSAAYQETEEVIQRCRTSLSIPWAKKIKTYLEKMLLPKDKILESDIELRKRDVRLLETLEGEMEEVEMEMMEGVKKTLDVIF